MGIIKFNNISSLDYGIQVEKPPDYSSPEKDYEIIHIPGRNGDLILDKGSYQNVERVYDIAVGTEKSNFTDLASTVVQWLHTASGYARLEDSYEPDYYRMAAYVENTNLTNILQIAGRATVTFSCKPQRFLKSGETPIAYDDTGSLHNWTVFTALPTITAYCNGDGVLQIGDYVVTMSDIDGYVTLNSEIQDCYKGNENYNSRIEFSKGYPKLISGSNQIAFSGNITSVKVIPNWWTL